MKTDVLKFGGTSMSDHQTWKRVLNIIQTCENPVVVVSATARTTRKLVEAGEKVAAGKLTEAFEIAEEIGNRHETIIEDFLRENPHAKNALIRESCRKHIKAKIGKVQKLLEYVEKTKTFTPQLKDAVAGIGEQISSYLLAQCGLALNMPTQHVEARKLIKTDSNYGKANPNLFLISQKCESLETIMESGFIPVIGGFYGEAPDKTVTTLGFEGSDYTAGLIGNALNASKIEIWTDVSGIYSSDPNFIEDARPIPKLNYLDATEMAYFGAKVLHPATLKPAREKQIPVFVKNIFKPENNGTEINHDAESDKDVLAVSFKREMILLTISAYETLMGASFLNKVFGLLELYDLDIDAIQTTEASVTIAMPKSDQLKQISNELIAIGSVSLKENKGIISLIGCTIHSTNKLSDRILKAADDVSVDLISFSKEKRLLSLVLDEELVLEMARKIYASIFQNI